ncbi:MAG: T9SS type A sorting domain-containing protein [Saprospiraceae bacterium]|nr:T9SS type A sorting domain-containing protein [Saprospiraceae bacterium]
MLKLTQPLVISSICLIVILMSTSISAGNVFIPTEHFYHSTSAQIVAYEYWFDQSGQPTIVLVDPTEELSLDIDLPTTGLTNGLHNIHIRFLDDNGYWSGITSQFFVKLPIAIGGERQIVSYQYWYDNASAQAIEVPVNAASEVVILNDLPTTGLSNGLHTLHVGFKDDSGERSGVLSQFFVKLPVVIAGERQIVSYQYWYDNASVQAVDVPVNAASEVVIQNDLPTTGLSNGLHTLHVRFKDDSGEWSGVVSQFFVKLPVAQSGERQIVAYQYWYDNASAQAIEVPVNAASEVVILNDLPTTGLSNGLHTLHLRFKDDSGKWGGVLSQFVTKLPISQSGERQIIAYQYWYDNASSQAVEVPITATSEVVVIEDDLSTTGLSVGNHTLHLRFLDNIGQWSGVTNDTFYVEEATPLTFYADSDGDTYGDPAVTIMAFTAPPGYVANSTDCNDSDPAINPSAVEACNSVDDNCDGFVDNNPSPVNILPSNPSICTGNGTTLTASSGTSYLWSTGETTPTISVNPTATTTYYVSITDPATQCIAVGGTTVTVLPIPDAGLPVSAASCGGTGATLTAFGGFVFYQWSTGQSGPNLNSIFVNPGATESYSVTVTTSAGCVGSDEVEVYPSPAVSVSASSSLPEVCVGNSVLLTAIATGGTGTPTFSWSTGAMGDEISVTPSANTTYSVVVTDAVGCTASDAVAVSVNVIDLTTSVSPTNGCPGEQRTIEILPTSGTAPYTYQWSDGLLPQATQLISPASTTQYTVSVTDANNCIAFAQIVVPVWQNNIIASPEGEVCPDSPVELSLAYALASGAWSTGETDQNITVNTTATADFSVSGTDINGCTVDLTYTVPISGDQPIIVINNSLSPLDGAINVAPNPTLFTWSPMPEAERYDLYVWRMNESRPVIPTVSNLQAFMSNVVLEFSTQYNWQIRAQNDCHEAWSDTLTFFSGELPDLDVINFAAPPTANYGQTIGLSWVVQNIGNAGTAASTWADHIWLSVDTIVSGNDILLGSWSNLNYLNPGESYTQTQDLNLPYGYFGVFYLIIESGVGIQEVQITNNTQHLPLLITIPPLPDLRVESVAAPTAAFGGDNVSITWQVNNHGELDATRDWYDYIYLSNSNTFNASNATLLGSYWAGGTSLILHQDSAYSQTQTVQIPYSAYGQLWLHVLTDAQSQEVELIENNNAGTTMQAIAVSLLPSPDLEPISISIPATASSGQTISVGFTIRNNGAENYPNQTAWLDKVFISQNAVFDNSAVLVGSAYHFGGIAIGGSYSTTISFQIPNGTSGNYYVFVKTDANDNVFEYIFENNNIAASLSTISISLTPTPDLNISNIIPSSFSMTEQQAYSLVWKTKNIGYASVTGPYREAVILSQNPNWDGSSGSFVSIGSFQRTGSLSSGDSITYTTNFILPNLADGGVWYFYIKTDSNNDIYEHGGELNNLSRSNGVTVTQQFADLEILGFNAPAGANSGSTIATNWQVRNSGNVPTGTGYWADYVWLSTDASLNGGDYLLGYVEHIGGLLPDSSYSKSRLFSIPNGLSGNYFLLLDVAYSASAVNDNNLGNDFVVIPILVNLTPSADLVITDLTLSSPVVAGQTYWAHYTVKNNGSGTVNGQIVSDRVFLGNNPALAGADDIGYTSKARILSAGQSYMDSVQVEIPAYANGYYYLVMRTDNTDNIYEFNGENNNVYVGTIAGSGMEQQPIQVLPANSVTANLTVTGVTAPTSAFLGDPVTIAYEIQNTGDTLISGLVRDITYLSTDNIFNGASDRLQKIDNYQLTLDEGISITRSTTAPLLTKIIGDHYSMARTNVLATLAESTLADNLGISAATIAVDARVLTLDVPEVTSLNVGDWDYYKFTVGANLDILVTLTNLAGVNNGRVFIGFNRVPTPDDYDFIDDNGNGIRTVVIPTCAAGTYYVLAQVKEPFTDQNQTEILVRALPFSIVSASPDHLGQGVVTTTLIGAGFINSGMTVELRQGGVPMATGEITKFFHSMKINVRWDLTNVPVGVYDVVAVKGGNMAILTDGVVVEVAEDLHLALLKNIPSQMRVGQTANWSFGFINAGNIDIPIAEIEINLIGEVLNFSQINKTDNIISIVDIIDTNVVSVTMKITNNNLHRIPLFMQNIQPGEQGSISFMLTNSQAEYIPINVIPVPYTKAQFLKKQAYNIERQRQVLLGDPTLVQDPNILELASNEDDFRMFMFYPFIQKGFIDSNEVANGEYQIEYFKFDPGINIGKSFFLNQEMGGGDLFLWEINLSSTEGGSAGENLGWDLIHATGMISITSTEEDPFWIVMRPLNPCDNNYDFLTTWEPWHDYLWPIAIAEGGFIGFDPAKFRLFYEGFEEKNNLCGGRFELELSADEKTLFIHFIHRVLLPGDRGCNGGPGLCGYPAGNGGQGGPAAPGGDGGAGSAGNGVNPPSAGGNGGRGGDAIAGGGEPCIFGIQGGAGGNGGIGGQGVLGQTGAPGGDGGNGGNGTIGCSPLDPCVNGGRGGNGGKGGKGGIGGNGGTGGIGGTGAIESSSGEEGNNGLEGNNESIAQLIIQASLFTPNINCENIPDLTSPECICHQVFRFTMCDLSILDCALGYSGCTSSSLAPPLVYKCLQYSSTICAVGTANNCGGLLFTTCGQELIEIVDDVATYGDLAVQAIEIAKKGKGAFNDSGILVAIATLLFDWSGLDTHCGQVPTIQSCDPNDIIGPLGYDTTARWVSKFDSLVYTVNFENDSTIATAPAQRVTVRVPLHENVNPFSLRLGDFGFAGLNFQVPENTLNYTKVLDVLGSLGVFVEVSAGLDIINQEAFWTFQAIDPQTGLPPALPSVGFLPINDTLARGQGFVSYRISPKASTITGDTATAQAKIVFDINDPIETNIWKNTIDAFPPASTITTALPAIIDSMSIQICWNGQDDPGGSGVKNYSLYYAVNGSAFTLYRDGIEGLCTTFTGQTGNTYSFFTLATDNVGNQEPAKIAGDITVTIVENYSCDISIDSVSQFEGNTDTMIFLFTVTRSNLDCEASVNYTTDNYSSSASDNDFVFKTGTLVFAEGESTQTIEVLVNGDNIVELDETFFVTLHDPVNATIINGQGVGTILNDDSASISITSPTITEGDAGSQVIIFDIAMSNAVDTAVTVNFATNDGTAEIADADYQSESGIRVIATGETTHQVMVIVNGDCKIESTETFIGQLSNLFSGGRNVILIGGLSTLNGTGLILNNDDLPVINCPDNLSFNTAPGLCGLLLTLPLPELNSICGAGALVFHYREVDSNYAPIEQYSSFYASTDNSLFLNEGIYEIEWQITDGSGTSHCSYYIEIVDNELPIITCPSSQTISLDENCFGLLPDYADLASTDDNCGEVTVVQYPLGGTVVSDVGQLMVSLTATDSNGNNAGCSFTVHHVDDTPPYIACNNQTITFNGESVITLDAGTLVTASDNCEIQGITLSPSYISCSQLGQVIPVTAIAIDVNGLSTNCTSQVNVTGLPCGWNQQQDGVNCAEGNSIDYNPASSVWTVTSTNCYYANPFNVDALAFAQQTLCGNGSIIAQVTSINASNIGWAGIIMRESNASGAKKVQLMTNLSSLSRREVRYSTNGQAIPQQFPSQQRYWLRLLRQGNQFIGYISPNGLQWSQIMAVTVNMSNCIQMGLVVTNSTSYSTLIATFANVSAVSGYNLAENGDYVLTSEVSIPDFALFPNPTTGELNVDLSNYDSRAVRIELYSLQGQMLYFNEIPEVQNAERLDLSAYQSGMYLVKVKSEGLPDVTKRIVLQRYD